MACRFGLGLGRFARKASSFQRPFRLELLPLADSFFLSRDGGSGSAFGVALPFWRLLADVNRGTG